MGYMQKCCYCGTVRPVSEMRQVTMRFADSHLINGRPRKFTNARLNWYCKDAPCVGEHAAWLDSLNQKEEFSEVG